MRQFISTNDQIPWMRWFVGHANRPMWHHTFPKEQNVFKRILQWVMYTHILYTKILVNPLLTQQMLLHFDSFHNFSVSQKQTPILFFGTPGIPDMLLFVYYIYPTVTIVQLQSMTIACYKCITDVCRSIFTVTPFMFANTRVDEPSTLIKLGLSLSFISRRGLQRWRVY